MQKIFVFAYIDDEYRLCGLLKYAEDGGHSSFEYLPEYLTHVDAISVDPFQLALPKLGASTVFTKQGMYFADFLAGSFEQQTCAALGIACGIKEMLLRNRQGFLRFSEQKILAEPLPYVKDWKEHLNKLQALRNIGSLNAKEKQKLADSFPLYSLGGMRPKTLYEDADGKLWMLKFSDNNDSFDVPLMEYATMQLANEMNVSGTGPGGNGTRVKCYDRRAISVPKMFIQNYAGENVLFIEMFDKNPKQLFISGLTVMGIEENDYEHFSYNTMFSNAQKLKPSFFGKELFRRIAFNILINNTDDHPRNHGFLYDGKNLSLAPCYDIVPTPRVEGVGGESFLSCSFSSQGRLASFENLYLACEKFGITRSAARSILTLELNHICTPQEERCHGLIPATGGWREIFTEHGVKKV